MRKVILSMQTTLDGFVCGPNDEMDWLLSDHDEWTEMFEDLKSIDMCLIGSKTYPDYSNYWQSVLNNPNASSNERKYAKLAEQMPHIVFSKSKTLKPSRPNARIASDPESEIKKLRQQSGKNIVVWGGASFASSLIRMGLIDEYRLTLNPVLLGGGKSLFKNNDERKNLELLEAKGLNSGLVILRYAAVKK